MKTTLSIILVTYRCGPEVRSCLRSLRATTRLGQGDVEVIVVDNDSGDGTAEAAELADPEARVLRRESNDGFAAGCNAGASVAKAPRLLFLNPDTVVPDGAIEELERVLETAPNVGAVGAALVDPGGMPRPSGRRFPTPIGELRRTAPRPLSGIFAPGTPSEVEALAPPQVRVDWITGACMLIRVQAYRTVGGLDEGFFLYFEETDWCRRARNAGWEVRLARRARVMHVGGCSARRSGLTTRSDQVTAPYRESRRRYFRKHHGLAAVALVEGAHWARACLNALRGRRSA